MSGTPEFRIEEFEGKYEILAKIAEGGMGAVYKVRHRLLEEVRVIKVMRPQLEHQEEMQSRFLREARLAVRMSHQHIARLFDFSIDDKGNAFIVMEFVDGATLQGVLAARGGPLPVPVVLELARQTLDALEYIHRQHIVHRDVSPDNIMVTRGHDGRLMVKLIDLGIAKVMHGEQSKLTSTGTFLGKVRYASPEQFQTETPGGVTARSDLYSLGLVMYELLTGSHPIEGSSPASVIAAHLFKPPIPFDRTDPDGRVPEEIRILVMRCLEKDASKRYQSAAELRDLLAVHCLERPVRAADVGTMVDNMERAHGEPTSATSAQRRLDANFPLQTTPPPGRQAMSAVQEATAEHPARADEGTSEASAPHEPTLALDAAPSQVGETAIERGPEPADAPAPRRRGALRKVLAAAALLLAVAAGAVALWYTGVVTIPQVPAPQTVRAWLTGQIAPSSAPRRALVAVSPMPPPVAPERVSSEPFEVVVSRAATVDPGAAPPWELSLETATEEADAADVPTAPPPVKEVPVTIVVFPPAEVTVGGRSLGGRVQRTTVALSPGRHVIRYRIEGWASDETTVRVGSEPMQVNLSLPPFGKVSVIGDFGVPREGVRVLIDGRDVGSLNLRDHRIAPGLHQVEVRWPDGSVTQREVEVPAMDTAVVVVKPTG